MTRLGGVVACASHQLAANGEHAGCVRSQDRSQGDRMRRQLIAGNWKMYKLIADALEYVQTLKPLVVNSTHCDIVIAPPFTALKPVSIKLEGSNVAIASQDVAAEASSGAFTGEVSAEMVRD